ncbi:MAG: aminotransferase class I/II-fold pyridoxal phosphate-dependent enzyme [Eubacteriales bacterium]
MKLKPFELEQWYVEYEFRVKNNISASCARPTGTGELLEYSGEDAVREYLSLSLDYIPSRGTERLREAVAGWYREIDGGHVLVTTGAIEAIWLLMNSLLKPGDEIIVEYPVYQSLQEVARFAGARVIPWPLRPENGYRPDPEELAEMITSRTKAVVINHPHSPTGSVISQGELERIITTCEKFKIRLISDEVYRGIVYREADRVSPAADLSPLAVSIGDMTKPFGLGGLRVGWIASRERELLEMCSLWRDYTSMCCSAPAEFLAALALEHRDRIMAKKIALARINLELLEAFIEKTPGVLEMTPPRGGFTAFPRYKFEMDSRSFCRGLIEQEDVLLLPGSVFGIEGRFRIGFGRDSEPFKAGLEALGRYIRNLSGK